MVRARNCLLNCFVTKYRLIVSNVSVEHFGPKIDDLVNKRHSLMCCVCTWVCTLEFAMSGRVRVLAQVRKGRKGCIGRIWRHQSAWAGRFKKIETSWSPLCMEWSLHLVKSSNIRRLSAKSCVFARTNFVSITCPQKSSSAHAELKDSPLTGASTTCVGAQSVYSCKHEQLQMHTSPHRGVCT